MTKKAKRNANGSAGTPVGLTLGDELKEVDREAADRGMTRAALVRAIVRKRYGLPNPLGVEGAVPREGAANE